METTIDKNVIARIRAELVSQVEEKSKASFQRFFKEKTTFYGVKSAAVSQIAKKYFPEIQPLGKKAVLVLCEELLKSDYNEEAFIAFYWAFRMKDSFEPGDIALFEKWLLDYVNNWAKCDTLCNHTIGALVEKFPQLMPNLKRWAASDNRWLKRAAAVTLIIPAKEGKFLEDIFEISDILLEDQDDLVQKGYGWLLKDASIKHQKEVLDYVVRNRRAMPRTALRYAVERMPADLKGRAMS